jgi:CMP-N-acetylneuraminic acid synthetase
MQAIPPITAIIFMKGHSARVPRKNLRPLAGRPLCHWILDALAGSAHIRQIIVNTDSSEIAESCRPCAKVKIHERPNHLLGDEIGANPLIEWDIDHSEGEYFLQSHSTNPLLTTATIDAALSAYFSQGDHDSLFSVTPVQKRFYWPDGRPVNHDPARLVMTQSLPPLLEENSCIYIFSRNGFKCSGRRIGNRPLAFPIQSLESVDIDVESDFTLAESLMKARLGLK